MQLKAKTKQQSSLNFKFEGVSLVLALQLHGQTR